MCSIPHLVVVVPKSNTFVVPGTRPPLIIIFPYPPLPSILLELTTPIEAVVTVSVFIVPVSANHVSM